jgi:hypothetical protein
MMKRIGLAGQAWAKAGIENATASANASNFPVIPSS